MLTDGEVEEVVRLVLGDGGYDRARRELFFQFFPVDHAARLPNGRSDDEQLRLDLKSLCDAPVPRGDRDPALALWLSNAARLVVSQVGEAALRQLRAQVLARAMPAPAPPRSYSRPADSPPADRCVRLTDSTGRTLAGVHLGSNRVLAETLASGASLSACGDGDARLATEPWADSSMGLSLYQVDGLASSSTLRWCWRLGGAGHQTRVQWRRADGELESADATVACADTLTLSAMPTEPGTGVWWQDRLVGIVGQAGKVVPASFLLRNNEFRVASGLDAAEEDARKDLLEAVTKDLKPVPVLRDALAKRLGVAQEDMVEALVRGTRTAEQTYDLLVDLQAVAEDMGRRERQTLPALERVVLHLLGWLIDWGDVAPVTRVRLDLDGALEVSLENVLVLEPLIARVDRRPAAFHHEAELRPRAALPAEPTLWAPVLDPGGERVAEATAEQARLMSELGHQSGRRAFKNWKEFAAHVRGRARDDQPCHVYAVFQRGAVDDALWPEYVRGIHARAPALWVIRLVDDGPEAVAGRAVRALRERLAELV